VKAMGAKIKKPEDLFELDIDRRLRKQRAKELKPIKVNVSAK
jgi:hypothetical protein